MVYIYSLVIILLTSCVFVENIEARSLILNWNPSPSPQIAGYNVYYGTTSGKYPYKLNVGNAKTITISGLVTGGTYYFVATAYNANGNESAFSPEVKFYIPAPPLTLTRPANSTTAALMQFTTETGHWYEVQASANLRNWTTIWQTGVILVGGTLQYTDTLSKSISSRYYRLVSH